MGRYNELLAYKKAFELAMKIFQITKEFPSEERYSLTDQIRRSSRSVCANIGESYRRRIYSKHFIAKLSDAQSENTETEIWLEFSKACGYIKEDQFIYLTTLNDEVSRLLSFMISNPEKFS